MTYRLLAICGSGIATSTVAAEKCKKLLTEKGLDIEILECNATDIASKLATFHPHVVVPTTTVSDSLLGGVKRFSGLPFITGIGTEQVINDIADYLKTISE
ncbi:PTS sugar transporter subunit IIB [Pectinatus brassicae]|uniref:PTS system galactitol-specific IIB component n=1 Tax=Pectinatus brassicae TaxID=862415 RepID=A0A840UI08_9FIRM|nr:PTS sugar transporter subunit IIB [Pectinatus brassicae]MBB5335810.1 PTS system galactitol-specific IIB component [Pectinatus brassicae]